MNPLVELVLLGNTVILLIIALFLNLQVRTARVTLLAHRARLEEALQRLEKEVQDLKAGSIVQLPPNDT